MCLAAMCLGRQGGIAAWSQNPLSPIAPTQVTDSQGDYRNPPPSHGPAQRTTPRGRPQSTLVPQMAMWSQPGAPGVGSLMYMYKYVGHTTTPATNNRVCIRVPRPTPIPFTPHNTLLDQPNLSRIFAGQHSSATVRFLQWLPFIKENKPTARENPETSDVPLVSPLAPFGNNPKTVPSKQETTYECRTKVLQSKPREDD